MRAVDIIRAKRDGEALSREAIESFVRGVTDGSWEDYQASALLMAIVLKGMNAVETAWLTEAMANSGDRVNLDHIPGVKVGKHSTGGVGDKVSIVLAAGGGVRRRGAEDVGPRPRPHRRHARQARKHSRLPHRSLARGIQAHHRRSRLLPDQPDRNHRAGRQEALRAA